MKNFHSNESISQILRIYIRTPQVTISMWHYHSESPYDHQKSNCISFNSEEIRLPSIFLLLEVAFLTNVIFPLGLGKVIEAVG